MNTVKFISFEMRVEFDIGETDYHVVWSSEEGDKKESDTDEEKEETKEKFESQNNFTSENDASNEDSTYLEEKQKIDEKEDTEKNNTTEKIANETIFAKQLEVDFTAINFGRPDAQQITEKKVDEENKISEEYPMRTGNVGKAETGDEDDNDMDETDDMKEEEALSENESPKDDDEVNSFLPANEEEPSTDNVEGDIRQYILELGAGPRRICLARKSSETSTPVFGQSTDCLDPEEMKYFGEAWAEAVFLCLERRVAAGNTLDEVMQGVGEELGLDKFHEIVEHFIGSMEIEQLEDEDEPEEDGNEVGDDHK